MTLTKEQELLLDTWVSGDLNGRDEEEVKRILQRSREATDWAARRRALLVQLGELPLSVSPTSDLWKGLESRLEDEVWAPEPDGLSLGPANHGPEDLGPGELATVESVSGGALEQSSKVPWKAMLIAAAVLVALAVGFSLGRIPWVQVGVGGEHGRVASGALQTAPGTDIAFARTGSEIPLVAIAEASLLEAKLELRRALDSHRERLPKAALATVDENLATIDRAIEEIRAALAMHPGDAELRRTLVAYHERELALLFQITRAGARIELNERSAS